MSAVTCSAACCYCSATLAKACSILTSGRRISCFPASCHLHIRHCCWEDLYSLVCEPVIARRQMAAMMSSRQPGSSQKKACTFTQQTRTLPFGCAGCRQRIWGCKVQQRDYLRRGLTALEPRSRTWARGSTTAHAQRSSAKFQVIATDSILEDPDSGAREAQEGGLQVQTVSPSFTIAKRFNSRSVSLKRPAKQNSKQTPKGSEKLDLLPVQHPSSSQLKA